MADASKRVLVALSGGISSAVAAALLKTQGYDVVAAHLLVWPEKTSQGPNGTRIEALENTGRCCRFADLKALRQMCEKMGIPLHIIDISDRFHGEVVDAMVHDYLLVRSPNSCVRCHSYLKFDPLLELADKLKCQQVVTGHSAKVVKNHQDGQFYVYKGADEEADQSYFLFGLNQKTLARLSMPLGDLLANNIEKLARNFDIPPQILGSGPGSPQKHQEICFTRGSLYKTIIDTAVTARFKHPGPVVDQKAFILGRHDGLFQYKVGQNGESLHLIGLPQPKDRAEKYIAGFDMKLNAVILGEKPDCLKKGVSAIKTNWIGTLDFSKDILCKAKTHHQMEEMNCRVTMMNLDSVIVEFEEAQWALQAGQAIVFYQGTQVLGGGWVEALTEPVTTTARSVKDLRSDAPPKP